MLKNPFKRSNEDPLDELNREKQIIIEGQLEEAEEAINLLSKDSNQDDLQETMEEITETVKEAAKASLRDIRLLEEGRCPSCGHKTNPFLFTCVCAHCGWFSFISPEEGKSIIHLKNGVNIECGTTFDTKGDYILGITEGVVRTKVSKDNVDYIEFAWTEEEISKKRHANLREQAGVCSWCEKPLSENEDIPTIVYAAFGTMQDRYVFCDNKCNTAFQKQYPVRVHRNCYHRSCLECDLCQKKHQGEDETYLGQVETVPS